MCVCVSVEGKPYSGSVECLEIEEVTIKNKSTCILLKIGFKCKRKTSDPRII